MANSNRSQHPMRTTGKPPQHVRRITRICRLAENAFINDDRRISTEHRQTASLRHDSNSLGAGKSLDIGGGRFAR